MRFAEIGKSGINASIIGLGTWVMGGWLWGGADEVKAQKAVEASINSGITLIDTAPAYGMGKSEEIVGRAIKGKRDKLVIATKCGLIWHEAKGTHFLTYGDGTKIYRYLGAESIEHEVNESLKRLGTDYIDLLQPHWQDSTTPIEETMTAMMKLKEKGKIRAIGVSNATLEQLKEYSKYGELDSDQEKYSMIDRQVEELVLPWCRENKVSMLAYSSMSRGLLTGKMSPDRKFDGDDSRKEDPRFSPENIKKANALIEKYLKPVAQEKNITVGQLTVAWLISKENVFALCGARDPKQALENVKAGDVILDEEDNKAIGQFIDEYEKNCI